MGRGRGGGRGKRILRRDFGGRENVWKKSKTANADGVGGWHTAPHDLTNDNWESYYKEQNIIPEGEWDAFVASMRTRLPITFRINGGGRFATHIRDQMKHDFFQFLDEGVALSNGVTIQAPRPLSWYPDQMAWQLNFSRTDLRKLPVLEKLHEYMKRENDLGSITRQEAVSMLPPFVLDVHPGHKVLDMCAAPGSKTFQLMEMVHVTSDSSSTAEATGLVVANDVDAQRCHLLVHQIKRMASPNVIVTNHEAQLFPLLRPSRGAPRETTSNAAAATDGPGAGVEGAAGARQEGSGGDAGGGNEGAAAKPGGGVMPQDGLLFDRVLCDVPCSGDGTMRKAPDLWTKWNPALGNGVHKLQYKIALRGAALTKVGGKMVYSTCSLNPVEDEAVVVEVLRRTKGALVLKDIQNLFPPEQLKTMPGRHTWHVRDKFGKYYKWSDVDPGRTRNVFPSSFPPGTYPHAEAAAAMLGDEATEDDLRRESPEELAAKYPLERCIRVLPHHNDTGGFFIALFEKVAPLPCEYSVDEHEEREAKRIKQIREAKKQERLAREAARGKGRRRPGATPTDPSTGGATATATPTPAEGAAEATGGGAGCKSEEGAAAANAEEPTGPKAEGEDDAGGEEGDAAGGDDSGDDGVDIKVEGNDEEEDDADGDGASGQDGAGDAAMADAGGENEDGAGVEAAGGAEEGGDGSQKDAVNTNRQRQNRWKGIDPIVPVTKPDIIEPIVEAHGIADTFPIRTNLVTRNDEVALPKRISFVATAVREVLEMDRSNQLKIIATGVKSNYRLSQEGISVMLPHLTRNVARISSDTLRMLLEKRCIDLNELKESDPPTAASIFNCTVGCLVVVEEATERALALGMMPTAVVCWRGKDKLYILMSKIEGSQVLDKLKQLKAETAAQSADMLAAESKPAEEKAQAAAS
eukprot:jgi/Mesvir1/21716/Mv04129-RA.3